MQNEAETGNGLIGSPEVPERGKGRFDGGEGGLSVASARPDLLARPPRDLAMGKAGLFSGRLAAGQPALRKDLGPRGFLFWGKEYPISRAKLGGPGMFYVKKCPKVGTALFKGQ